MKRNSLLFTFTALTLLLSACNAAEVNQNQKMTVVPTATSGNTLLSGSTKSKYMKPGAPVHLSYTSAKVQVGETSNIEAVLHLAKTDLDQVQVEVHADEGIVLEDSPGSSFVLALETDKLDYPLSFSASSVVVGLQYINLQVTTSRGDQQLKRAFSIPVQTGSDSEIQAMKRSTSPVEYDENGEAILPMEAEETIN